MNNLADKVAVITGAASGIGKGIAEQCAAAGMNVVIADIRQDLLDNLKRDLDSYGTKTLAVKTNVSDEGDVKTLANMTIEHFGAVHLLCNNAGVGGAWYLWECTRDDWDWVFDVNLWGVVNGIRTFVPIMLDQGTECHIVNTSSSSGFLSIPFSGIYAASKHAVTAMSEVLYHELSMLGAPIGVSVLCPDLVKTDVFTSEKRSDRNLLLTNDLNRKMELFHRIRDSNPALWPKIEKIIKQRMAKEQKGVMEPAEIGAKVLDAVRKGTFYIHTNSKIKPIIQLRMHDILLGRNPTNYLFAIPKFSV